MHVNEKTIFVLKATVCRGLKGMIFAEESRYKWLDVYTCNLTNFNLVLSQKRGSVTKIYGRFKFLIQFFRRELCFRLVQHGSISPFVYQVKIN